MKGMEFKMILGLIIMIAVILLVVLIVINPGLIFGEKSQTQISFREACIFWSLNRYEGTTYEHQGIVYPMNGQCESALGLLPGALSDPSDPKWEECRNLCRVRV